MKLIQLFLICVAIYSYQSQTACERCLERDIEPECGTNGVTYVNRCQRRRCAEDVDKAYDGICRCDCEARPIQLICGADGLFYRNACALECAGVPRGFNCGNQNTGNFNCQSC